MHISEYIGAPPQPSNITILNKIHGYQDLNVTLSWDLPAGRVDNYHLTTSDGFIMSLSGSTAKVFNIPYNMNITIEIITMLCGVWGESIQFTFAVGRCMKYTSCMC